MPKTSSTVTSRTVRRSAPALAPIPDEKTAPAATGNTVTPESGEETPTARLSLPLTADGHVDTGKLREKTKGALKRALDTPGLSALLGVPESAVKSSAEDAAIIAHLANAVYDGLSVVAIKLAQRAGYPIERARVMAFTPEEKAVLADPTARVVSKYFPDFGGKYRDEILLGFVLMNVLGAKIMMLRAPQAQPAESAAAVS